MARRKRSNQSAAAPPLGPRPPHGRTNPDESPSSSRKRRSQRRERRLVGGLDPSRRYRFDGRKPGRLRPQPVRACRRRRRTSESGPGLQPSAELDPLGRADVRCARRCSLRPRAAPVQRPGAPRRAQTCSVLLGGLLRTGRVLRSKLRRDTPGEGHRESLRARGLRGDRHRGPLPQGGRPDRPARAAPAVRRLRRWPGVEPLVDCVPDCGEPQGSGARRLSRRIGGQFKRDKCPAGDR
jgi:hypothetical protein